jgi:hypothetical protein
MSEEESRRLNDFRRQREEAYTRVRGIIKGIQLGAELNTTEENILTLLEFIMDALKVTGDDLTKIHEEQTFLIRKIENVQQRIGELEKGINQLTITVSKLVDDE